MSQENKNTETRGRGDKEIASVPGGEKIFSFGLPYFHQNRGS